MKPFFFIFMIILSCSKGFANQSIDFTQYSCEDLRGLVRRAGPSGAEINGQMIWSDMFGSNYGACNKDIEALTTTWVIDETGRECPIGNGCTLKTRL